MKKPYVGSIALIALFGCEGETSLGALEQLGASDSGLESSTLEGSLDTTLPEVSTTQEASFNDLQPLPEASDASATGVECATTIALGREHSCATRQDGSVWCWGLGMLGQLGLGTEWWATSPTALTAITGVSQISGTSYHNCALKTDKTVWCWGKNEYAGWEVPGIPEQVGPLGADVTALSAGERHSCALKAAGALWCFGDNHYGQLGDGTTNDEGDSGNSNAKAVPGFEAGTTLFSAGGRHTCANHATGQVWCWGENSHGQLGDGGALDPWNSSKPTPTPQQVVGLNGNVVEIAAGGFHTCVRLDDGSVWCFGSNESGQLGDGTLDSSSVPVMVWALGYDAVQVSSGESHTCARKAEGTVWCWGGNGTGQLGDGTTSLFGKWKVVQVSGLTKQALWVHAGNGTTCAALVDGSLWCWGENDNYQVGTGKDNQVYPFAETVPLKTLLSCP